MNKKRWSIKPLDTDLARKLAQETGKNHVVAKLLAQRGFTTKESIEDFLSPPLGKMPNPMDIEGIPAASAAVTRAITGSKKICVFGDFDVDGVTASSLMSVFFEAIGADHVCHIPVRSTDGYGLTMAGIDQVAALGAQMIITVDCGVTAVREAEYCRQLGIELLITDHHLPGDEIPDCTVINPNIPGREFPFKDLPGVGVAFMLAVAVRMRLRAAGYFQNRQEPRLGALLPFVAMGIVADIVPIHGLNRIFAYHGMREIAVTNSPGIKALLNVSEVKGRLTTGKLGYAVCPRINASGRISSAGPALDLLRTGDPLLAAELAEILDTANKQRKEIEAECKDKALKMMETYPIDKKTIVLAGSGWHTGVLGIVCSRLLETYNRPVILLAETPEGYKGSGRSITGFNMKEALEACSEHLGKYGGHAHAAGVSLPKENLEAFVDAFEKQAAHLTEEDLTPMLKIDLPLAGEDISLATYDAITDMEPFGPGNTTPVFYTRNVEIGKRTVFQSHKGVHTKYECSHDGFRFTSMLFNEAGPDLSSADIVFTLGDNEYMGRRSLSLTMKDIRPHKETGHA